MMYSETKGNELYVYRNGELIYKKWLNQNNSVVFNNPPNWKHDKTFSIKERSEDTQNIEECTHCNKVFEDGKYYWKDAYGNCYCIDNECGWEDEE